jgi:enamine deaminase RidA (YjgF/YER057c/UK114 family)
MSLIKRIATDSRRSRGVVYNGLVFIGGQTADDRSQDIRGQTRQALAKIDRFLTDAGPTRIASCPRKSGSKTSPSTSPA